MGEKIRYTISWMMEFDALIHENGIARFLRRG